jgi:sugar phosphate isomerase/epimerase
LRKFPFEKAIEIVKGMGVKYLSLNPVHLPLDSPPEKLAAAKQAIADAGLTLMSCGVIKFDTDEAAARQAFEYAKALELPVIVGNPTADSFGVLDKLIGEYSIRVAIHNHGPGSIYQTPEDTLEAIKGHDERLGACVDFGHYERVGVKAADAIEALWERIYDVHLKDVNKQAKDGHAVVLGKGVIDIPACIALLLKLKFEGLVALEYEEEADAPQEAMAQSFAYFKEMLAKQG